MDLAGAVFRHPVSVWWLPHLVNSGCSAPTTQVLEMEMDMSSEEEGVGFFQSQGGAALLHSPPKMS